MLLLAVANLMRLQWAVVLCTGSCTELSPTTDELSIFTAGSCELDTTTVTWNGCKCVATDTEQEIYLSSTLKSGSQTQPRRKGLGK